MQVPYSLRARQILSNQTFASVLQDVSGCVRKGELWKEWMSEAPEAAKNLNYSIFNWAVLGSATTHRSRSRYSSIQPTISSTMIHCWRPCTALVSSTGPSLRTSWNSCSDFVAVPLSPASAVFMDRPHTHVGEYHVGVFYAQARWRLLTLQYESVIDRSGWFTLAVATLGSQCFGIDNTEREREMCTWLTSPSMCLAVAALAWWWPKSSIANNNTEAQCEDEDKWR